jgi:hypothetical protein
MGLREIKGDTMVHQFHVPNRPESDAARHRFMLWAPPIIQVPGVELGDSFRRQRSSKKILDPQAGNAY